MLRPVGMLVAMLAILAAASVVAASEEPSIRTLPVPIDTILPGEVISADRLTERQFKTTPRSLAGVATRSLEVVGRETRRRLLAGLPISLAGLGTPYAVKRGAVSFAIYRGDGFSISTEIILLSDGVEGEIISARSTDTGAIIKVEVLPGGELQVAGE